MPPRAEILNIADSTASREVTVLVTLRVVTTLWLDKDEELPLGGEMRAILAEHAVDYLTRVCDGEGGAAAVIESLIDDYKIIDARRDD